MKTNASFLAGLAIVMLAAMRVQTQDPNKRGGEFPLAPGARAIAIQISDIPPGVIPGSSVDVVHTLENKKKRISRMIVEKVKVVAIDIQPAQLGQAVIWTVTLEVTAKQALKLGEVRNDGEFTLLLLAGDAKRGVAPKP